MQASGWSFVPLAPLADDEFASWSKLLEERSGVVLPIERRSWLETRLTARMRELDMQDYSAYLDWVAKGATGAVEWQRLLDWLMIQETRFFRHPPSFACVRAWLEQRLTQQTPERPLLLWSLGCSTGEEAWSLAITSAEVFRQRRQPLSGFSVLATDISQGVLKTARAAYYSAERLVGIDTELRERYFTAENGSFRVIDSLRARLCFVRLNALDLARAPFDAVDLVFSQNMLLYFRRWQRRNILNALTQRLLPGGMLVTGLGEAQGWQHPALMQEQQTGVQAFVRRE